MNIPIYRAKKIDSNEYTEGFLYQDIVSYVPSDGVKPDEYNKALDEESWFLMDNMGRNEMIDITTLAIHFPVMIDSQGNKIFASLSEDGKGGDIVEGKCRDVNGDTITRLHKPLPYKGLVRFYKETLMSVVIETKDEIIEETKGWNTPIYVNRGEALRWCDCRQDIKVIGIQE